MPFVSRCTSLAGLLLVLAFAVMLGAPVPASAQSLPSGVTCTTSSSGVRICTDGSVGSTGSVCITDNAGNRSCLSGSHTVLGVTLGTGLGSTTGLPSQTTGTGWLSRLTGWIAYAINTVFTAVVQVLKDLVTYVLAVVLGVVQAAIAAIQPPDFLSTYSMGSILGNAGSIVGFFLSEFQVGTALALIGGAYAFRLLRKFLTLFQW